MAVADDFELPVPKRLKPNQPAAAQRESSRLFAPFRTIGLVSSTRVPFTSVPLGKTTFQITTSVGRSLQTYDLRKGLSLVFLSRPQCPQVITATVAYRERVFAAWGNQNTDRGIWVLKRGSLLGELEIQGTVNQEIEQILVFGSWIIGCGPTAIEIWRNDTYEHYTTIRPSQFGDGHSARAFSGCVCTLPTFLNKIFVGKQDGRVDIFNITTGKLVYSLTTTSSTSGKVTALSPTMALSMLAIARADGTLQIVDVEMDEIAMQLQVTRDQPITSISFRSDGAGAGNEGRLDGVMATSSSGSGDIALWDLNNGGKLSGILRDAHDFLGSPASGINKVEFLAGQAVLVSSGLDNSLRSWIFDQTPFSPVPRALHARRGHASTVTNVRFLPAASDGSEAAGKWLLSAGQDRSLWGFSLRKDTQSSEISQGNVKAKAKKLGKTTGDALGGEILKASPVVDMACSLNRDGGMGAIGGPVWTNPKSSNAEQAGMTGWESIVTAHENDSFARTWFWGRKKAGRWTFQSGDRRPVSSVAITTCGTFAVVGSQGGALDMFNLQSGMHRQRFPPKLKPAQAKQPKLDPVQHPENTMQRSSHKDRITGIVVDSLNRTMVSTGVDGAVIFWDFATGHVKRKVLLSSASPTALRYSPVSNLISISCDDLCIRIIDIDTFRTVRELWGCAGQIYDHCFSHDGRWIVASSMDSIIRVFDLATGHLIDAFKTTTCTSVAISSTGEFLATTHAGSTGINIWNNKSLYSSIPAKQVDDDTGVIDLTMTSKFDAATQLVGLGDKDETDHEVEAVSAQSSIDQLDEALLTLSLVPPSRWQTLLNLDSIRDRNKPIAPPDKPKAAPFFLGSSTLSRNEGGQLSLPEELAPHRNGDNTEVTPDEKSRIARLTSLSAVDEDTVKASLTTMLKDFEDLAAKANRTSNLSDASTPIIQHMTSLPPSQGDLAIRTLTLSELPTFIHFLTYRLRQRRDFELVNTWMAVLLRCHVEFVQVNAVRVALEEFKVVMDAEAERLASLVGWVRGVGDYLRSAR